MITRRNFIVTSAATASSPLAALQAAEKQGIRCPLRALPRVRTLFTRSTDDGRLFLISDGSEAPPKLIRTDVLEHTFGLGTDLVLQQPDHWRMIEAGWFTEDELYQPTDFDDPPFRIWHANYRPEIEAHDLLYDLFQDMIKGPFGARIPELGLELSEHPTTPRYATAKLDDDWCLHQFITEVSERTSWLVIDDSNTLGEQLR